MINLSELKPSLIALAENAANAILTIYEQSKELLKVHTKPDRSPLTQADLLANSILLEGLKKLTPDYPILSEEGVHPPWKERKTWTTYWLLDPLDGTRPFISHAGEFTVNIALIVNHAPVLGLVYVPITHECYFAEAKTGAYKIDASGNQKNIHVRSWQTQHTHILTSHGARPERIQHHFGHLGNYTMQKLSS